MVITARYDAILDQSGHAHLSPVRIEDTLGCIPNLCTLRYQHFHLQRNFLEKSRKVTKS